MSSDSTSTVVPPQPSSLNADFMAAALARLERARQRQRQSRSSAMPNIPGYEIVREIGRGGMGVVYQARDLVVDRDVAIKMLHSEKSPELERFRHEARLVAQLQHASIVEFFGFGECLGAPYFVMEYVDGESLADFAEGRPHAAGWSARLIRQLAEALHHAHQRGIVHRDLKPSNILLHGRPEPAALTDSTCEARLQEGAVVVKVADFGLAWDSNCDYRLTRTGCVLGTPGYMAPEQLNGDREQIGLAADIYALGVILYELLTGSLPFQGDVGELLQQMENSKPSAPSELVDTVPLELERICLKCLESASADRYQDMASLMADLDVFLGATAASEQAAPVATRRRNGHWLAGIAVVLFVLGWLAGPWSSGEPIGIGDQLIESLEQANAKPPPLNR